MTTNGIDITATIKKVKDSLAKETGFNLNGNQGIQHENYPNHSHQK